MERDGQWANSEQLWLSATQSCPQNFVSHVLLGDVYDKQGRKDEALAAYKESLKWNQYYMHGSVGEEGGG